MGSGETREGTRVAELGRLQSVVSTDRFVCPGFVIVADWCAVQRGVSLAVSRLLEFFRWPGINRLV